MYVTNTETEHVLEDHLPVRVKARLHINQIGQDPRPLWSKALVCWHETFMPQDRSPLVYLPGGDGWALGVSHHHWCIIMPLINPT